jgi:hypothetical protein
MHQVATRVWNEIGETVHLRTDWAKQIFPLPDDQMEKALSLEEKRLMQKDRPIVVSAYLMVMPLLWERDAIAQFKAMNPNLMAALPEVESVQEAVMLASSEFPLDDSQQKRLAKLLQTPPT